LPDLARGFWVTIQIALLAQALCLVLGLLLAVARQAGTGSRTLAGRIGGAVLRGLAIAYINFFRAVPALVVLLLMAGSFPFLPIPVVQDLTPFQIAFIGLGFVYAAYVAEVYRAGIESVHPSQTAAARSLGLSRMQSRRHVVLPQAVRRVIPPLLNDFIGLQKDSALVAFLGVIEGLQTANIISSAEFNYTPFVSLALVYLVITIPQTRFVDWLVARDRRRRQGGTVV
jgi:polar amino acid transport system permease protein